MLTYAFWNNKGGTGKTTLIFQTILEIARRNPKSKILVIDLCPQANLSDLLLGGLLGNGGHNLDILQQQQVRKSVGGYFQDRISTPYTLPQINVSDYLCIPNEYNGEVSGNIELLAGDRLVEVQANSLTTLSNTRLPGVNSWLAVVDWINNFINATEEEYEYIFIDTNPSFSIYTQIALAASDRLVLPVMADDSSRRAIQNVFSLVHGIRIPQIYHDTSFSSHIRDAGRQLPQIHLIVKNRLTQYMGPASAYQIIFQEIDNYVQGLMRTHPNVFTFTNYEDGVVNIRDFQTAGVVATAKGLPFFNTHSGRHNIFGRRIQLNQDFLGTCVKAIGELVNCL